MLIDQAWTSDIVTILGRIADRIAHIAHTALIYQIHNQLYLMQAFEVGNLWLITSLDKGLKSCLDQGGKTTTENSLLTKEVCLGLFAKGGLQNASPRGPNRTSIG